MQYLHAGLFSKAVALFMLSIGALFFSVSVTADENYSIVSGEVLVTPSFCPPDQCKETSALLSGEVSVTISDDSEAIYFPSYNLNTEPDISFLLPIDPELDSGGTNRNIEFSVNGNVLEVKGVIDSRAFDGPLIEYTFSAQRIDEAFNPKGFFTARPDFRKCVSPLCGGYFIKKVNRYLTRCADGSRQKECYVAELVLPENTDRPNLGFGDTLLLKGKVVAKDFDGFGNLGAFVSNEAYLSVSESETRGRFIGLENNGLVCITSPCFSYDKYYLNRRFVTAVSSFNLDQAGANIDEIEHAMQLLADGEVLLASGFNRHTKGLAGRGIQFVATQFYLPIKSGEVECEEGYQWFDSACRTPFGCEAPLIELTTIPGLPEAPKTQSCVKTCDFPAFLEGPAECRLFLP